MKQKLSYIVLLAVLAMAFVGCSTVQKIINTGDAQFIFERAKDYYTAEMWGILPIAVAVAMSLTQIIAGILLYKKHH